MSLLGWLQQDPGHPLGPDPNFKTLQSPRLWVIFSKSSPFSQSVKGSCHSPLRLAITAEHGLGVLTAGIYFLTVLKAGNRRRGASELVSDETSFPGLLLCPHISSGMGAGVGSHR